SGEEVVATWGPAACPLIATGARSTCTAAASASGWRLCRPGFERRRQPGLLTTGPLGRSQSAATARRAREAPSAPAPPRPGGIALQGRARARLGRRDVSPECAAEQRLVDRASLSTLHFLEVSRRRTRRLLSREHSVLVVVSAIEDPPGQRRPTVR